MKSLFKLFLFSVFFNIISGEFFLIKDSSKKSRAIVYRPEYIEDEYQTFYISAFLFPKVLQYAKENNLDVILYVPSFFPKTNTMASDSFFKEGVRIALTWAGVYFRFIKPSKLDLKILVDNQNKGLDKNLIFKAFETVIVDKKSDTKETMLERRIIKTESLKDASIKNYYLKKANVAAIEGQLFGQHYLEKVLLKSKLVQGDSKKTILITGGAGFVGSHLARLFLKKGYQVIVLDNLSCCTGDNIADLLDNKDFEFHRHDITKSFTINKNIDYVVHMACLPSPAFYYTKPLETLTSSLYGTRNTLELALEKGSIYIFSSTSEIYGDPEISPQHEKYEGNVNPIGKRSQYCQSKRAAEVLIKIYTDRHLIDSRIVRIFNTYGPGMLINDGRVITNFISQALKNEPLIIHGTGNQTRSFAYVTDTAEGIMRVIETNQIDSSTPLERKIFNVGTPHEFTINELAQKINKLSLKYFKREISVKYIDHPDSGDPERRKPDITRIKNLLGFEPVVLLDQGLEKTFLHYMSTYEDKNIDCNNTN